MARTETVEFRTAAGGHYQATHVRNRGKDNFTLVLLDDSEENEFQLPDDGSAKELMFVYGLPSLGNQFRALEYVNGDPNTLSMHMSSPVTWLPTDEDD